MVKPEGAPEEGEATTAAPTTTSTTGSTTTTAAEAASSAPKAKPVNPKGYAYLFKYVLVGDCGAGKTALLQRFAKDDFTETHNYTIGVDFAIKTVDLPNGDEVKLQMWDTAGQERFRNITTSYYRGTHGVIVVYDMTNKDSFQHIVEWVREVGTFCKEDTLCMVVGTKKDKAEEHSEEEVYGRDNAVQLLQDNGLMKNQDGGSSSVVFKGGPGVFDAYEVSAKTGENVNKAFQDMTDKLVAWRLDERNPLRKKAGKTGPTKDGRGSDAVRLKAKNGQGQGKSKTCVVN